MLAEALKELDEERDIYMKLDAPRQENRLSNYSMKYDQIIRKMNQSRGSNLVYSQFLTVEGLGILGMALKANGYVKIDLEGPDSDLVLTKETAASIAKGPDANEKRFIMFTGEGSKEKRTVILNIFNGRIKKLPPKIQKVFVDAKYENNNRGEICWVIGITAAGAEGISLSCCRAVHIMEPYWNSVRLEQVKGRAVRICSHEELPYEEREVEVYTYCTVFSKKHVAHPESVDVTIRTRDGLVTSDERVLAVSKRKDTINNKLLTLIKESAVDCELNAGGNGEIQCKQLKDDESSIDRPDTYMFDPNLEIDIQITNSKFKDMMASSSTPSSASTASTSSTKTTSRAESYENAESMEVEILINKGIKYLAYPQPGTGEMIYNIYARTDEKLKNPIGVVERNPMSADLEFYKPYFFK
jgi:hypothetical protein